MEFTSLKLQIYDAECIYLNNLFLKLAEECETMRSLTLEDRDSSEFQNEMDSDIYNRWIHVNTAVPLEDYPSFIARSKRTEQKIIFFDRNNGKFY